MKGINFFFYCLPAMLILLIIFLILSIFFSIKKINKLNKVIMTTILVLSIVLVGYYLPKNNILGKYNISYIDIQDGIGIKGDKTIKDQNEINEILKVINNYNFTRSAVKTVEGVRFQSNDLITLNMQDTLEGKTIFLYILDKQLEKDLLQINEQMYKVKNEEEFNKDIFDVI